MWGGNDRLTGVQSQGLRWNIRRKRKFVDRMSKHSVLVIAIWYEVMDAATYRKETQAVTCIQNWWRYPVGYWFKARSLYTNRPYPNTQREEGINGECHLPIPCSLGSSASTLASLVHFKYLPYGEQNMIRWHVCLDRALWRRECTRWW